MIIELFEEHGKGIAIDSEGLQCRKLSLTEAQHVVGVGAIVDEIVMAFYCHDGSHVLRIGEKKWRVETDLDQIVFVNQDNGVSRLMISINGVLIGDVAYRSWWIRYGTPDPIALADDDDSEHDFGAYLAFMWETSQRREYLLKKYSG